MKLQMIGLFSTFFLMLYGTSGIAQDVPNEIKDEIVIATPPDEQASPPAGRPGPAPGTFVFISSEFDLNDQVVKGAPYSAEASTERVQVLGDGNRIVQKSNSRIYRDGEGRTRREQELGAIGAWAASGEVRKTIFINDPVAKVHYICEPEEQTARKMRILKPNMERAPLPPPGEAGDDVFFEAAPAPGLGAGVRNVYKYFSNEAEAKKESLGTQMMEGVQVEGTRTTTTIPAQQIGNERAIEIVSEKWYSPELKAVVMSRHTDPRFGESTYKLVNINRSEPDASLFQPPAGYKIVEIKTPHPDLMIKKEIKEKPEKP